MRTRAPFGYKRPITDPSLLSLRAMEIEVALDSIAPQTEGEGEHVLILGDSRSGKTSTLLEVARRADEERERVVVHLCPGAAQLETSSAFVRHFLLASVEAVASRYPDPKPEWYLAWRERVYLRNHGQIGHVDSLTSGLILASDPEGEIDPVILRQDLTTLVGCARSVGPSGLVVCLDDASDLTADVGLLEHLLACLDSSPGWNLLLAGAPTCLQHLVEAASPGLRRFQPVRLAPFRAQQIMTCLRIAYDGADGPPARPGDLFELARDLVRLTGGNPFEVMLVARHMWLARELGENDTFTLTRRVLDRVVSELAIHTSGGEELRAAARAIRRLEPGQMRGALELVALSRLSVREIAIARALEVTSGEPEIVRHSATSIDVDQLEVEVLNEVATLQDAGVLELAVDDSRFTVLGGRAVSVLLKYEARLGRTGTQTSLAFDMGFLMTVGRALVRDVFATSAATLPDARRLANTAVEIDGSNAPRRDSARQAIARVVHSRRLDGVARLSLAWTKDAYDRVVELIDSEDSPTIALVAASVSGTAELEYVELWEISDGTTHHVVTERLAESVDRIASTVETAELKWRGVDAGVVSGDMARDSLMLLEPFAASQAVSRAFQRFRGSGDRDDLTSATLLADRAVRVLRANPLSVAGRFLLSGLLSKAGFLKAFDDEQLTEAEVDIRSALDAGPADGWVTRWNLANVLARQGRYAEAEEQLAKVASALDGFDSEAYILFYRPGRSPVDSLVTVPAEAAEVIVSLQRRIVACESGQLPHGSLETLADDCRRQSEGVAAVVDLALT